MPKGETLGTNTPERVLRYRNIRIKRVVLLIVFHEGKSHHKEFFKTYGFQGSGNIPTCALLSVQRHGSIWTGDSEPTSGCDVDGRPCAVGVRLFSVTNDVAMTVINYVEPRRLLENVDVPGEEERGEAARTR